MDDAERHLREQLLDAFGGADFPVDSQIALASALPEGPTTRFEVADDSYTAMELATRISDHQEFPYETVEALVDDVVEAMRAEGLL